MESKAGFFPGSFGRVEISPSTSCELRNASRSLVRRFCPAGNPSRVLGCQKLFPKDPVMS